MSIDVVIVIPIVHLYVVVSYFHSFDFFFGHKSFLFFFNREERILHGFCATIKCSFKNVFHKKLHAVFQYLLEEAVKRVELGNQPVVSEYEIALREVKAEVLLMTFAVCVTLDGLTYGPKISMGIAYSLLKCAILHVFAHFH